MIQKLVLCGCLALCMAFAPVLPASAETSTVDQLAERLTKLEEAAGIRVGGALRVNYGLTDWSESSKDKGGDFAFDTFRLDLNGEVGKMILSAQYRWYPEYDFDTIHHGYIGYNFTEDLQGQIGVHQVPFGIQPYASHNFWFSGAYYVGLEDDYDMGLKLLYTPGPWGITAAFYKNAELGNPSELGRYSVDLVTDGTGLNEEVNQENLRVAYTFEHGDLGSTELGLSGEYGQTYNANSGGKGDHWAGAAHLVGNYGNFNLHLEYAEYDYDLADPADGDTIRLGAYSFAWDAPAEASIGIVNLAYTVPVSWGPISSVTLYSDNTIIEPEAGAFDTAWQNVLGAMIAAGPVYTYVDVISGENMIFMNGNPTAPDGERNTRLNINFGYYF
ncbi:hypothetical protein [Desulfuromonas sp.]|uniref:hypothetical protein n=1 Tax=Desulfuromonas sp. TaxID=892 RepID=UPI0025B96B74|nr:hypothetical protein [Desulfuromonas sp.]